ncbi:MAG: phage holin family protein [Imperialibacter sp.]|uniref:phage holin family protein n=1 Tax=Imperialibacter sp. TaxID=2038411 RepID=UPI0032EE1E90
MNFLIKLLLSAISVILTSYLLPGVTVEGFWVAFLVAVFLSLLNVTLKPILVLFTIPITFLTLGLFLLVINALIIMIADYFIDGFYIDSFWWALAFGLILSIINSMLNELSAKSDNPDRRR